MGETYNRKLAHFEQFAFENTMQNNDESLLEQIKSAEDEVTQSLRTCNSADNEVKNAPDRSRKAQLEATQLKLNQTE